MTLLSNHILDVLRICMALEKASMVFYAYAWMNEAWGSQGHVWACRYVTLERELLASHAYAWTPMHMRGKDEVSCHA
ncbi:hypothetical protein PIB30_072048 [Stylosanthes scabra]|uniref:Uncharacterized protein n=1 Tax=Stylosanthes scabra TaxID=79078 RepID=A0ABU6WS16_9FABA|nr:hypothetical protein [Stylosanthes scabra]